MPNYCDNSLSIEGPHDTLRKIHALVRGEENPFDFEKIIPMPDYIYRGTIGTEEKKIYGNNNWYDWRCENWGTKWNSCDANCDWSPDCLEYDFETAWSPCEPVIKALATLFPDAQFKYRYSEQGDCFFGDQEYENGRMTYNAYGDYGEYWFDGYSEDDEDDREILKEKDHPGIFYTVIQEEDLGPVTATKFSYRDNDNERSIQIEGVSYDARAERKPFVW